MNSEKTVCKVSFEFKTLYIKGVKNRMDLSIIANPLETAFPGTSIQQDYTAKWLDMSAFFRNMP